MHHINIHKVLNYVLENKIYTIFLMKRSCKIQIYYQKLVLIFLKYQKRALNRKFSRIWQYGVGYQRYLMSYKPNSKQSTENR